MIANQGTQHSGRRLFGGGNERISREVHPFNKTTRTNSMKDKLSFSMKLTQRIGDKCSFVRYKCNCCVVKAFVACRRFPPQFVRRGKLHCPCKALGDKTFHYHPGAAPSRKAPWFFSKISSPRFKIGHATRNQKFMIVLAVRATDWPMEFKSKLYGSRSVGIRTKGGY